MIHSLKSAERILLVLLAVFCLSRAWGRSDENSGIDFYQFWAVGQALGRAGVTNVYSDADRTRLAAEFLEKAKRGTDTRLVTSAEYREELETYSSPFLYALFRAGAMGRYATDLRRYRFILLACLTASVVLLARLLNYSWNGVLGAVALFAAWFEPFASDMRVANVNSLQLAALSAWLWIVLRVRWRCRDLLGGAVLGLALTFKPNLVFVAGLLAIHWILNRRLRRLLHQAAGAALGAVAGIAVGAAGFGSFRCWADWISAARSLPGSIITYELGNYAPARILFEWIGFDVVILLGLFLAFAVGAAMWLQRRSAVRPDRPADPPDPGLEVLILSVGCALVILMPRLAWLHYYVFTIPIFLFLLRPLDDAGPLERSRFLSRLLAALALVGLAAEPFLNIGVQLSTRAPLFLIVLPAVVAFALGLRELATLHPGVRPVDAAHPDVSIGTSI